MSAYTDYQDWFNNTAPGTTQNWAGGSITMGDNGTASYVDPLGNNISMTRDSDMMDLYNSNPYIAQQWGSQYSDTFDPSGNGGLNLFQPDLFPSTTSSSGSYSTSGINWDSPFMQQLLPSLTGSVESLPGLMDNYARTLQDQQTNTARQMLGTNGLQGTLNDLASRGILDSSVGASALANTSQGIMQGVLDKGYSSELAAQQARMNLPGLLGQLAQLGQQTTSSSGSSSKTSNPLAPYELAAKVLLGLQ